MTSTADMPGLELVKLSVSYGPVKTLFDVDLEAQLGAVTGLIGPNGAGKTTLFNACSGLLAIDSGTVRLLGGDVTRRTPAHRARAGLGRTFQRFDLIESMSVRANVALGAECRAVGSNPIRQLIATRSERQRLAAAADDALVRCGLERLGDRTVATLSTGQRRLVELARIICGDFRVLLLDEPSSGLDDNETAELGEILSALVADGHRGVLLVEHDMSLVMGVCDRVFVLEFGAVIFDGTAVEARSSDIVRHAYLGTEG